MLLPLFIKRSKFNLKLLF